MSSLRFLYPFNFLNSAGWTPNKQICRILWADTMEYTIYYEMKEWYQGITLTDEGESFLNLMQNNDYPKRFSMMSSKPKALIIMQQMFDWM